MNSPTDTMFSGIIGQDYDSLKLICPLAAEMSRLVGQTVRIYCQEFSAEEAIQVLELGSGTGVTTLAILSADERLNVLSVDNEPTMQRQAMSHLCHWKEQGRLVFSGDDALTALQKFPANHFDFVASAYTLHNFNRDYREQVVGEIFRVLKPEGWFINGDRYGLDDLTEHTKTIQREVASYFDVLTKQRRLDLLESWIIHLFQDESENHIMRERVALQQLADAGFTAVCLTHRMEVNALVTARK